MRRSIAEWSIMAVVNNRRSVRIATNWSQIVRYIQLASRRLQSPRITGPRSRHLPGEAPLDRSSAGAKIWHIVVAAWRDRPVPLAATGLDLSRLAPRRQKGSKYSHAELRPRLGLEPTAYCLGGTPVTWPGVAPCGPTWVLAAAIIAGRSLTQPCACGHWLPVWLPEFSLATLMFECVARTHLIMSRTPGF